MSVPRTPTAAFPLRTASSAYSTWNRWPSGEKTVIARSYRAILSSFFRSRVCFLFEFDFVFFFESLRSGVLRKRVYKQLVKLLGGQANPVD